jgi:hypothetical protein
MLTERDVVSLELLDVGGVGVGENCEGERVLVWVDGEGVAGNGLEKKATH